jgi:two-component system chemotaxis response regulator CheY
MTMAKTVLTVDDSRTMRDMLLLALSEAGYRVVQAVDGVHGLEVLQGEAPDVIVTDINMPRMDGFGFIESVRRSGLHRATPILVLTTESDAEKKSRARQAGATGWIVKPFNPAKLVDVLRRVAA